ncbi:DUF5700 domain-containing putative Zn-dependent protease [Mucilaginibacter terrae]|uniref:DUF2268 domain-containing protein n=1 Tax=Mucilaginibacter terrae TaxID=1955052 RepID=A0ABU3H123_9SPHI|nr:DUF5700 domain-containing putative Zn-dependent protease [Mucilaginibacter terrae]MDT3405611.1 hypothetical protein [Mucilaginibacter terrae]
MKRIIFIFWLIVIQSAALFAQSIDASLCDRYFEITDKLRKGDSLSRDTWNTFLQDKSIQTYMADQGVDQSYYEAYRKNMQIVYMPQKDAILQRRLKDSLNYWLTYTIYQYKKHEDGMKAYLQKITADPQAYFNVLYKYAYTALPKRAHIKLPQYIFTIIPIHNDAHAQNNWIIYTLMCAYFNDSNKLGALGGHELHHALQPVPDLKPDHRDESATRVMYAILNEGSADMVDKKYMTDTAKTLLPFQRYFEEFYNEAKPVMPHLDSMLQLNAKMDTVIKFRNYLKGTAYTSGHVPGTYMAYYIEKNGLKGKLLKRIEDPYYFFMVYNEAAKKDKSKPYVFSKEAMDYIELLHKKYMQQVKHT